MIVAMTGGPKSEEARFGCVMATEQERTGANE
jgi:hypothetical protein